MKPGIGNICRNLIIRLFQLAHVSIVIASEAMTICVVAGFGNYRNFGKELRLWIAPPAFWRPGFIQDLPD